VHAGPLLEALAAVPSKRSVLPVVTLFGHIGYGGSKHGWQDRVGGTLGARRDVAHRWAAGWGGRVLGRNAPIAGQLTGGSPIWTRMASSSAILGLNSPALQAIRFNRGCGRRPPGQRHPGCRNRAKPRPLRRVRWAANAEEAAALELTRCVTELGFKGVMLNCFTQRRVQDSAVYYDLPEFRPFWATVVELDVPFYLHPG